MYTHDPHAFEDPEAAKSGKYRPRVRLQAGQNNTAAVNLNLFPLSEKGVLRLCVTFDLELKVLDSDGPVWWK